MTAVARARSRSGTGLLPLPALLVLLAVAHLTTGATSVPVDVIFKAIVAYDPASFDHQVVWDLRLPRLAAALLCGTALGLCGMLLQSILRNPLGEPHILGLNAGASLAVVVCISLPASLSLTEMVRPIVAAAGGGLLFALVLALASVGRSGATVAKLTFCGIALSALASAVVSAILVLDQETLEQVRHWLAGDLAGTAWAEIGPAFLFCGLAAMAALLVAPRLDALALGDATATALGVPVRATRAIGLGAAALLCGCSVSIAGPIGFVGLIVPGVAYRLAGRRHIVALPVAALCGSILLLAADLAARSLLGQIEIATGIMTALVGAPAFLVAVSRTVK